MTENIFENGGEFCMRGDPEHKPVEWHWFDGITEQHCVFYSDGRQIQSCRIDGTWSLTREPDKRDLIPIPSPPQIVPWESRKDVPAGIWVRHKQSGNVYLPTGFTESGIRLGAMFVSWQLLFEEYDLHTCHDADDGWQPCGKVVKS